MKLATKTIAVILIVIIIAGVGAYAGYTFSQNTTNNNQPAPTPTSTASPTPTMPPMSTPSATPAPTTSATPGSTATPAPSSTPSSTPAPTPSATNAPMTLTVATTTSLHDTGLEDNGTGNLKDAFQAAYPFITINFVAQGTGAALATAQAGDADMVLVHSPSQELTFMQNGYGVDRKIIASNFFVIVGPANDPAGIRGMTNVSQALIQLYNAAQTNPNVQWFSRNDSSGTATAEANLWKAAGFNYNTISQQTSWFHSTGAGMGQTLQEASNGVGASSPGYTLSDTGTYLAYYNGGLINLKIIVQQQQSLLNVYSAIIDNPKNPAQASTNFYASWLFVTWLTSPAGQQTIGNYGISQYGQQLFTPFVPMVSGTAPNATLLSWIQSYAYMSYNTQTNLLSINASGTECPTQYRYIYGNLYDPSYDQVVNMNQSLSIGTPNYYVADGQKITVATILPSIQSLSKATKA